MSRARIGILPGLSLAMFMLIGAFAIRPATGLAATTPRAPARPSQQEVAEELTCQCGCGLTVANCNHPNCSSAGPMREQIDRMLLQGMSKAQIVGFFRVTYGEKVLSAPTTQGFNLLAWIMPFIALIIGGAAIVVALGRWRSRAVLAPLLEAPLGIAPSDAAGFDPDLRRRLEREVRDGN